jgi:DNA-directed RNA polymerase specialized sigma24 family protein
MSHQKLNEIFETYIVQLYAAAKRMIDNRDHQYADKVQDLVVLAYEEFIRKGNEGRTMSLSLLIHYMKLRKKEVQLEMRGYSRTDKTDVFNKRNYYEGKLELYSLNNPVYENGGRPYIDSFSADEDIQDSMIHEIDFNGLISTLTLKEKNIIEMKINGFNDNEIATALSIQIQTVKNILTRISLIITNKPSPQLSLPF